VIKKLTILMYPPSSTHWSRLRADEVSQSSMNRGNSMGDINGNPSAALNTHKWALPKDDVNAPDLYIPVMSFITYCILVCYAKRAGGASGMYVNTPDILINAVWKCCILQVFEAALIYGGLSMMSVSLPFLDIISYTGYKYVGLCASTIMLLFGSTIYFIVALYSCAMLGYFILKSMAAVVPKEASGPLPRHIMLVVFAGLQFLIAFILSCY
jgi:protein transport protein YIF1